MFSGNPLVRYIRLTLKPCFARLFGKRRCLSSLCLFLTLFLCSLLLSCICLIFGQNLTSSAALASEFDTYITLHGVTDSNRLFRESIRVVLAHATLEIYVTHICFVCLWLVASWIAVCRVFKDAVATETYVYALYIIYGADTKQLRKSILREFWMLGIPAFLLAIPVGIGICRSAAQVSSFSFPVAAEMLLAFSLLSLLCTRRITKQLFKKSCAQLLTALDTSEYIASPRRVSVKRALRKRNGFSLSLTSFFRMRSYRIVQALSLSLIGALLFSMTALTLPDNYATEKTSLAYVLGFEKGVSYEAMENDYLPAVESLEAVALTERHAADTADRLGTHLLLEPRQIGNFENPELWELTDKWALDTVKIACGDGITEKELGEKTAVIPEKYQNRAHTKLAYTLDTLQTGKAAYLYPEQNGEPKIQVGDTVKLAIPDGTKGYDRYGDHITVEIIEVIPVGWVYTVQTFNFPVIEPVCPRIFEDYLFLSPDDYATVSGIPQTTPAHVSEADAELLGLNPNNCYLLLPEGMQEMYGDLTHVTVITPDTPVKKSFTSIKETSGEKPTLPTDTYFINDTAQYTGVYLGKAEEYASSFPAVNAMEAHMETVLNKDKEESSVATEYRVAGRSFCQGLTAPCVIFTHGERVSFTSQETELSAIQLKASACMDRALYFMDREDAVLTSDDGKAYAPGTTVLLTTALPSAFLDAMEKAEVALNAPERKYQLTESRVVTSFQKGSRHVSVISFFGSSLAARDRYPIEIDGVGSYLPINDRLADSILRLSDIDSMLVFEGDPKGERDHAYVLQGDIALNHFTLTPEREAGLSPSLGESEALLRLPEDHPFALEAQDLVHIALALPLRLDLTQMDLQGVDLLAYQLETLEHSYLPLTLTSVETDTTLTAPVLIVSESTFCQICARDDVISEWMIYVDSDSSLDALAEVSEVLGKYLNESVTLDESNAVLKSRSTGSQRYPVLLRTMILPLCLLLILLPLSAARTLGLRREKERSAYIAAGVHRNMSLHMSLGESIWASLLSGGLYALFCPMLILLLKLFCGKFHVPLKPESFSSAAFFFILALILLSSMGTARLSSSYARRSSGGRTHKHMKGEPAP